MALSGEVDHLANFVVLEEIGDELGVADVAADEVEPLRVFKEPLKVGQVSGVGELVQRDQPDGFAALHEHADEVGPDESGGAGDEERSHILTAKSQNRSAAEASTGYTRSFSERIARVGSIPQSIPNAGSFQRMPRSCVGE